MKCGFYETEITPPIGTTIFGYFITRANEGIISKLYAKAAVIEAGGKYVAMLSIDCLALPKELADFVRERVYEKTGIKKDAIFIAATHTHTGGPNTDTLGNFKDRIALFDDEPVLDAKLDKFYLEMIKVLSADAIINAYQRLEEAEIGFAIGEPQGINFIREYVLKNGEIRTNPGGAFINEVERPVAEPDRALPIFFVKNKEGKPMGLITSFALHHDTVHGCRISADYSGILAKNLKEKYGNQFTTVFYQGFCGNLNHMNYMKNPEEELETKYIAEVLTDEIIKMSDSAEPLKEERVDFKMESVKIKKREVAKEHTERVLRLKENPPSTDVMTIADPYCDIMVYAGANGFINYYVNDQRTEYDVPVHALRIGECLILGFCGEMFCQFGDIVREQSPADKIMLVEKANTEKIDGYFPTREMFLPNVYESSYTSAKLCPDAGYQMCDLAIKLAKDLFE